LTNPPQLALFFDSKSILFEMLLTI
jgi:hypothetical protein